MDGRRSSRRRASRAAAIGPAPSTPSPSTSPTSPIRPPSVTVLYNTNLDPERRIRNPDNLDWAGDGRIYVQEDRATSGLFGAGAANPYEASILSIDPTTGAIGRVAEMNRAAVGPFGSSDSAANDVGRWESSGILDVSRLFGQASGTLFLADVQAHSIVDGAILANGAVAGGQLVLIAAPGASIAPAVSRTTLGPVDRVIGSNFADTIVGDAAGNDLRGGAGDDRINGGGGDDRLNGGTGADALDGGTGANDTASYAGSATGVSVRLAIATAQAGRGDARGDVLAGIENLFGSAGGDVLVGDGGANRLTGVRGDDVIKGLDGNDRLIGGIGRDIMAGGAAGDTFDFNAVRQMGTTATTRDRITDFRHLIDDIDLSSIDANGAAPGKAAFTFLAARDAGFTGARGQLSWLHVDLAGTARDRTIIAGDVDGDRLADFQIELTGLRLLGVADFVL